MIPSSGLGIADCKYDVIGPPWGPLPDNDHDNDNVGDDNDNVVDDNAAVSPHSSQPQSPGNTNQGPVNRVTRSQAAQNQPAQNQPAQNQAAGNQANAAGTGKRKSLRILPQAS